MSQRYATYGWASRDLDELTQAVGEALQVTFERRWSDEWGGHYWNLRTPGRRIKLVRNFLDEDGVLLENARPDVSVILDSTGLTQEECDIMERLGGQVLGPRIL